MFNVEQIDGLAERYTPAPVARPEPMRLIAEAEDFFAATGRGFRHGDNRAFYAPAQDAIQAPRAEVFRDAEIYAPIKAHELVDWPPKPHGARVWQALRR